MDAKVRNIPTEDERDDFNQSLVELDSLLENFVRAARNRGYVLDNSLESLVTFEGFVLESMNDPTFPGMFPIVGAWKYLGEVVRVAASGVWALRVREFDYSIHNWHVVEGEFKSCGEFYPLRCFVEFMESPSAGKVSDFVLTELRLQ